MQAGLPCCWARGPIGSNSRSLSSGVVCRFCSLERIFAYYEHAFGRALEHIPQGTFMLLIYGRHATLCRQLVVRDDAQVACRHAAISEGVAHDGLLAAMREGAARPFAMV